MRCLYLDAPSRLVIGTEKQLSIDRQHHLSVTNQQHEPRDRRMDSYYKLAVHVVGQAAETFRTVTVLTEETTLLEQIKDIETRIAEAEFLYARTDAYTRLWFGLLKERPRLDRNKADQRRLAELRHDLAYLSDLYGGIIPSRQKRRSWRSQWVAVHPWVAQCYGE